MEGYETVGANPCVRPLDGKEIQILLSKGQTGGSKGQTHGSSKGQTHGSKGQTHGSAPTGYKYNRRSLRLKHYDYSREGYYFITIVAQNREHLFGEIVEGEMVLNEAGVMVEKWYMKLEDKFQNIQNHKMVIMPNHIHFIVQLKYGDQGQTHGSAPTQNNMSNPVGADLCVRPNVNEAKCVRPNILLGDVIQWFKTMTTNTYIKMVKNGTLPPFNKRIWQRNYYEHVVRDDVDYVRLETYIQNNPLKWEEDMFSKSQ